MFYFTLHTGGKIERDNLGVYYSEDAVASFCANDDITFVQLREEVYGFLGISKVHFDLRIWARCNHAKPPMVLYHALDIINDHSLQFVINCLRNSRCRIMELWVDKIPKDNPQIGDHTYSGPSTSRPSFDV